MTGRLSVCMEMVEIQIAYRRSIPRLGLILLATDKTTEGDVARSIPPDVAAVHATRIAYANPTAPRNLREMLVHLGGAAELIIPGEPLAAICYACTAASAVLGEDAVTNAIQSARPAVPVITPLGAAERTLISRRARRIALLTPYLAETARPVAEFFQAAGLEVVKVTCLGMEDDRMMAQVDDTTLLAAARIADHDDADALFISCTALPAMALSGRIEAMIGKPVVTSNQACINELRVAVREALAATEVAGAFG
jgi:maleate isomerase